MIILETRSAQEFFFKDREATPEGKKRKAKAKYEKFADSHKEALDSYSEGLGYESGIALTATKN